MTESEISKRLIASLRKDHDALIFKFHGHMGQQAGIPDFFVQHEIFTGWIETKKGEGELTPLQKRFIKKLNELQHWAFVVRFIGDKVWYIQTELSITLHIFKFEKWNECAGMLLEELAVTKRLIEKAKLLDTRALESLTNNSANQAYLRETSHLR